MTDYPTLTEVIGKHEGWQRPNRSWECAICEHDFETKIAFDAHIAQAWRDVCTLTTVEALAACPRGTVVMAADGKPFRRWPAENGEDHWTSGEISLPALLIWHPGWSGHDVAICTEVSG
jgi:hypothetical protein